MQGDTPARKEERKESISITLEPFSRFFRLESNSGILLLACTLIALCWANSPWAESYFVLRQTVFSLHLGDMSLAQPIILWINDGIMAIFFFVVGLEIKREVLVGALSKPGQAILPIASAFGGMLVPAGIFWIFNAGTESVHGWGIPMATDIAFALAVLTLLGDRVPAWIKVFLTATAIADDIGAILVIALFYSHGFSAIWLAAGLGFWLMMWGANLLSFRHPLVYAIVGSVMWAAFLKSGIHSTFAGVLAAMAIPARSQTRPDEFLTKGKHLLHRFGMCSVDGASNSLGNREQYAVLVGLKSACGKVETPLQYFQHTLHPWVSYIIIPLFALANAGVDLSGIEPSSLMHPVVFGIGAGLLLGKQAGIFLTAWAMIGSGLASKPADVEWQHIYGAAWLGGIGFTMSIFIATLAFSSEELLALAKLGVLSSSLLAGLIGWLVLRFTVPQRIKEQPVQLLSDNLN